jgi:hypothetical protein
MEIELRAKYRTLRPIIGFPAKPRTGNSHGLAKGKWPAHQPCNRAPAGGNVFKADEQAVHTDRVLRVNGLTGARRMEDA